MPGTAYDAIIVGAGPAGTACAALLGRRGRRVLLLDRAEFPRYKLCTHAIMPAGLPVLADLGVLDEIEAAGAQRWYGVHLWLNGMRFSEPLPAWKTAYPYGLSLTRTSLDALLLQAARSFNAVTVYTGTSVSGLVRERGRVTGLRVMTKSRNEKTLHTPLVVLAGGRHTRLIHEAGVKTFALPNRHTAYFAYIEGIPPEAEPGLEGYYEHGRSASLLPANGCLRIGGVMAPAGSWEPADVERRLLSELRQFPSLAPRLANARIVTRPISASGLRNVWRNPVAPGVLLLGDAGLQTDPLFGQGISWALRGAAAAAEAIDQGLSDGQLDDALSAYGRRRALVFGHRYTGMSLISMVPPGSMLERLLLANATTNPASTALFLRLLLGYATVSRRHGTPRTVSTWLREALRGPRWQTGMDGALP